MIKDEEVAVEVDKEDGQEEVRGKIVEGRETYNDQEQHEWDVIESGSEVEVKVEEEVASE